MGSVTKWVDVYPANKETAAMLRFTLTHCQGIKKYTAERILNGDRKPGGPAGGAKRGVEAWLRDYLAKTKATADIPRYALRDALAGVWEDGVSKQMPWQKKEWNIFRAEPRAPWKEAPKQGPLFVNRRKDADRLFEQGELTFRWGKLKFKRKALEQLNGLLVEKGWLREELLERLQLIEFYSTDKEKWQVNFIFE